MATVDPGLADHLDRLLRDQDFARRGLDWNGRVGDVVLAVRLNQDPRGSVVIGLGMFAPLHHVFQ